MLISFKIPETVKSSICNYHVRFTLFKVLFSEVEKYVIMVIANKVWKYEGEKSDFKVSNRY